ncbi:DUF2927 domain-containing protein [Xinfangfangia pollutisoli]|uniref:DUF2927 domain-containing protein n=1 Tax=Xinfangfangia pollutisoli TaxID=2865960 RepID=UPI00384B1CBC
MPRSPSPAARPPVAPSAAPLPDTAKSAAARAYFAQVQAALLSQGLMRTDGGGPDTPFDSRILAENFLRVALFDEYSRTGGAFVRGETASILRRWDVPVRVGLRFGASVPEERRAADRARIGSYLARLAKLTGHSIALADSNVNFTIHIVSEDERELLGPQLAAEMPGLSARDIADVTGMPRTTYCLVYALSPGNTGAYNRAVAVVRAEHPDLLRQSCFHEEIAQGLGLANDSPLARPSIFNDDEEFALLTRQDELMLRMLYDPALRPGMRLAEARPIVESLARRLMGGET